MTARALSTIETETYRQQRSKFHHLDLTNAAQNLNLPLKRSAIQNRAEIGMNKPFWGLFNGLNSVTFKDRSRFFLCGYLSTLAKKRKVDRARGE
jgi:hypothetical protein